MFKLKKWHFMATVCCFCTLAFNFLAAHDSESHDTVNAPRKYRTFNYPDMTAGGQTLLTGIRGVKNQKEQVYISGFYNSPNDGPVTSFIYKGTLNGKGTWHPLNFPPTPGVVVTSTNLYGPTNGKNVPLEVVGNYFVLENGTTSAIGCLYQGPLNGSGKWTSLIPPANNPVLNTIAHSTMNGLVVGNYETQPGVSKAFIYDIKQKKYHQIKKKNARDITAYGIWHNCGHSYTICGGYSDLNATTGVDSAYLVDWNSQKKKLSNWRTYNYNNNPKKAIITHFDGITSDGHGGYNLTGDWLGISRSTELAFFCNVSKHNHAHWAPISYPNHRLTSGNSVYKTAVIGVYTSKNDDSINGYISTVK